jgi:hypothetical protein
LLEHVHNKGIVPLLGGWRFEAIPFAQKIFRPFLLHRLLLSSPCSIFFYANPIAQAFLGNSPCRGYFQASPLSRAISGESLLQNLLFACHPSCKASFLEFILHNLFLSHHPGTSYF